MKITVGDVVGMVCLALFVAALGFNASVMLVSPKAWFRMPFWIRLSGSLRERDYGSGWGAIQVRLLGALLLVVMIWVPYHSCSMRR